MSGENLSRFLMENMTTASMAKLQQWSTKLLEFAHYVSEKPCKGMALVTSGGTAVPIEVNSVRYLSNFSSGGRGAGMVEALLQRGWACVFLYHEHSSRPFRRNLDHLSTEQLFAELAAPVRSPNIVAAMQAYERLGDRILYVPFNTVTEYLFLLQLLSEAMSHRAECLKSLPMMLIAAAAVSDYFIPLSRMSTHKISGGDGLHVHFENVPKALDFISERWHLSSATVPRYLITFKLETEEETLKKKALENLFKYKCDAVVANMLQNYRERVVLYWKREEHQPVPLLRPEGGSFEALIVDAFLERIEKETSNNADSIQ
ncbi:hypothetical protein C3747_45g200 [Trypanosoma cruzi]|uniref:DNA/pantothenate metabolism flavoprotein C-terminal domain-containing protein n=1 Tax=Trypanosoma cruzi TaxID=5693 RepID=A0A2V2WXD3_TRYCR|nr:hypothetical protein C3747_45g200 [Trypanosoma cruzi]